MSTEHKISNATRFAMLSTALLFDAVQFITPGWTDHLITAFAAAYFMTWFLQKDALTLKGKALNSVMGIVVIVTPFLELLISHLPGITVTVFAQIQVSRMLDRVRDVLPERLVATLRGRMIKEKIVQTRRYKNEATKIKKLAYGKGRRGVRTSLRKLGLTKNTDQRRRNLNSNLQKELPKDTSPSAETVV